MGTECCNIAKQLLLFSDFPLYYQKHLLYTYDLLLRSSCKNTTNLILDHLKSALFFIYFSLLHLYKRLKNERQTQQGRNGG